MVKENILEFVEILIPVVGNYRVNKKVKDKVSKIENSEKIREEYCPISSGEEDNSDNNEYLKILNQEEIKRKSTIEDKAKNNIIGITIAISLVLGSYGLCNSIYTKFTYPVIQWGVFFLFTFSVVYMIAAGIISINTIVNENVIYVPSHDGIGMNEKQLKHELNISIGKNRIQNLIRNNCVYTSYECIRNAMVFLFLILLLATVPVTKKSDQHTDNTELNIFYSSNAISFINVNDIDMDVDTIISEFIDSFDLSDKQGTYGMIDEEDKLFIKFRIDKESVNVIMIELISNFE